VLQNFTVAISVPPSFTASLPAANGSLALALADFWNDTSENPEGETILDLNIIASYPVSARLVTNETSPFAFFLADPSYFGVAPDFVARFYVVFLSDNPLPSRRRLQNFRGCQTDCSKTCNLTPPLMGNPAVSSPFGVPRTLKINGITIVEKKHPGVDFKAPSGTPVYAAMAGLLTVHRGFNSGRFKGDISRSFGYHVTITSECQSTLYGHMQSGSADARDGKCVQAGVQIGLSDNTGRSQSPHLHFQYASGDVPGGVYNAPQNPLPCIKQPATPPNGGDTCYEVTESRGVPGYALCTCGGNPPSLFRVPFGFSCQDGPRTPVN